jgi:hypothetical protein
VQFLESDKVGYQLKNLNNNYFEINIEEINAEEAFIKILFSLEEFIFETSEIRKIVTECNGIESLKQLLSSNSKIKISNEQHIIGGTVLISAKIYLVANTLP